MQDERDDRIDQTIDEALAALRQATPPHGIEARIEHRLQQHQRAACLRHGWRDILRGSTLGGAWFRGAVGGACVAMTLIAGFLAFNHRTTPAGTAAANSLPVSAASHLVSKPVVRQNAPPCAPAVLRALTAPAPHSTEIARGALPEHYHQPLELPLTRQERDLVRLVHIAGPQQLATLTTEAEARSDAEQAATFEKFFTPPPRPKIDQDAQQPTSPVEAGPGEIAPDDSTQDKAVDRTTETTPNSETPAIER